MSGAFGIGGAVVSTPGVRLLGASAFVAVGTTLPSIFPSAVAGTARYVREGFVDWRAVGGIAPAGVAAAVGASLASHLVPGRGHWLMVLTAVILGGTAWKMAIEAGDDEAAGDQVGAGADPGEQDDVRPAPGLPALAALGAVAGGLSGLLGLGGGAVLVPGLSQVVGLPLKRTIATSLACVGVLAVPSTVAHAFLGDIDWHLAVVLAIAVVPGARLGAAASIRAGDRRLRMAVALCLGAIALGYGGVELIAAVR